MRARTFLINCRNFAGDSSFVFFVFRYSFIAMYKYFYEYIGIYMLKHNDVFLKTLGLSDQIITLVQTHQQNTHSHTTYTVEFAANRKT